MASDYRKDWQGIKKALAASGINVKDVADKVGFGPALDDYVKNSDALESFNGQFAEEQKLREKKRKSGTSASQKGAQYLQALAFLLKGMKKVASKDPEDVKRVKSLENACDKLAMLGKNIMEGVNVG